MLDVGFDFANFLISHTMPFNTVQDGNDDAWFPVFVSCENIWNRRRLRQNLQLATGRVLLY